MNKDNLFKKKKIVSFDFGKDVANVFDDMLDRSVPLYRELQYMIGSLSAEFAQEKTNIYDLGCSTGNTMLSINKMLMNNKISIIGIDNSTFMLEKAKQNTKVIKGRKFLCLDLNQGIKIKNASVVILNLTLQFIRPIYRDRLIEDIYRGLNKKGCLILIEKVMGESSLINSIFIKLYYEMKLKKGYSNIEIAKKREALENVLIPYKFSENVELLKRNGFDKVEIFYKWYNFCGFIALK